jgi:hypothetical protein
MSRTLHGSEISKTSGITFAIPLALKKMAELNSMGLLLPEDISLIGSMIRTGRRMQPLLSRLSGSRWLR